MTAPEIALSKTVLGSADPPRLAAFYRDLLGWEALVERPDWVVLAPGGDADAVKLAVQHEPHHQPPTWPAGPTDQQMQAHLDVRVVGPLADGVRRAVELGAREADHQPQDDVRVLVDPDGHPFCLFSRP